MKQNSSERAKKWYSEHAGKTHKQITVLLPVETYERLNALRGSKSWAKFLEGVK